MMTIEQTVEVPANRHVAFDLPYTFPVGKAKVEITVTSEGETAQPVKPLRSLRGIDKGQDTVVETDIEKYPWEASIGMFKDSTFSTEELFKERARDLLRDEAKLFRKISLEALEKAAKHGVTPEELGLGEFV